MDGICTKFLDIPASESQFNGPNDLKAKIKTIFSRLLRRPNVDVEDDFFDLGGDSILAIALFNEIEKLTGRLLPVTALYEASSVNSLVRLLTESDTPRFSSLTLLKSGKSEKPVFLVPGIAGAVFELRELARLIDIDQAIYGLEAAGVDGTREPYDRVEELARFHVENLVAMQTTGPYYLVGYSFGGLVALEMALMLLKVGKPVALLALIDTFPNVKYWPLLCRLGGMVSTIRTGLCKIRWLTVLRYYATTVRSLPFHSAIWYILIRTWRVINFPFNHVHLNFWIDRYNTTEKKEFLAIEKPVQLPINLQNVGTASSNAFKFYKPKYYPLELTFIKADNNKFFDANQFWEGLCQKLTVEVVPGDHHSMVKQNPRPLAIVLTKFIKKASNIS